jgi:hypothetical protein
MEKWGALFQHNRQVLTLPLGLEHKSVTILFNVCCEIKTALPLGKKVLVKGEGQHGPNACCGTPRWQ